jgi:hypothetical protein
MFTWRRPRSSISVVTTERAEHHRAAATADNARAKHVNDLADQQ